MLSDLFTWLEASVEQKGVCYTIFASKYGPNIVPSFLDNSLGFDSIGIQGAKPIWDQNKLIKYQSKQFRMTWIVIFAHVER